MWHHSKRTTEFAGHKAQRQERVRKLKGNIFVGDFGAGRGLAATIGVFCGSGLIDFVTAACGTCARASRGAFGTTTKHAEVVCDDFKTGALLAFLVLPFAGLDAAFDENQRTLLQILLGDFRLLAPDDDLVPLGALLAFAVTVFVGFIGGQRKICDGLAAAGVARLGIAAEAADEDDFVDGHKRIPPAERKIAWGEGKVKSEEREAGVKPCSHAFQCGGFARTVRLRRPDAKEAKPEDFVYRVAVTAAPSSFSLARARRSSSLPGKRLTTSRSSRIPPV